MKIFIFIMRVLFIVAFVASLGATMWFSSLSETVTTAIVSGILCAVSFLGFVLSIKFPIKLYYRTFDIDIIEQRYNQAVFELHKSVKRISDKVVKDIADEVVRENPLVSGLDKKAKELAKDFEDVKVD